MNELIALRNPVKVLRNPDTWDTLYILSELWIKRNMYGENYYIIDPRTKLKYQSNIPMKVLIEFVLYEFSVKNNLEWENHPSLIKSYKEVMSFLELDLCFEIVIDDSSLDKKLITIKEVTNKIYDFISIAFNAYNKQNESI